MRIRTNIFLLTVILLIQCGIRQDQVTDNGMNILYHLNGNIESQGNKLNGLEVGEWNYYHENGKLAANIFYKNGKADGKATYYYESGNLESTTNWINGIEHGEAFHYYESGKVKDHGFYKNGKQDNKFTFYTESGNIDNIQFFDNGEIIKEETFHTIMKYKVVEAFYKYGTDTTQLIIYYGSGKKYADIIQKGKTFPFATFYYENGDTKAELKNSSWQTFDESGKPISGLYKFTELLKQGLVTE